MNPFLSFFITVIVCVINGCLWGAATHAINRNKGYWTNGFWWGFWLGWIGLIVVLCKSDNNYVYYSSSVDKHFPADQPHPAIASQPVPAGGWRCTCGRVHAAYVTSCTCGNSKISTSDQEEEQLCESEERTVTLLKEYKALLDNGTITQEEFDQKKNQLLHN